MQSAGTCVILVEGENLKGAKMKEIDRWQLNPVPRGATYRSWDSFYIAPRILYAYQLLYVFGGSGEGRLDGEAFPLEAGTLVMYGPGCRHEFRSVPGAAFVMAMICFSWYDVGEEKRALGNRFVGKADAEYWRWADEPVRVAGLPEFPFRLVLPDLPWRREFEVQLKELGSAWRLHFTQPLVYRAKSVLAGLLFRLEQQQQLESPEREPVLLARILNDIYVNHASDLLRGDVAARIGISESYLTALLLKHRHMNFTECLNAARLKAALELLQYSNLSINEIAEAVGFNSTSYFVERFRRQYGVSPGKSRRGLLC